MTNWRLYINKQRLIWQFLNCEYRTVRIRSWMLPLTKLIRTVGTGFRMENMVQTVTWLSDSLSCRKILRSDLSITASMSNTVSLRCMAFLDITFILLFTSTVSWPAYAGKAQVSLLRGLSPLAHSCKSTQNALSCSIPRLPDRQRQSQRFWVVRPVKLLTIWVVRGGVPGWGVPDSAREHDDERHIDY